MFFALIFPFCSVFRVRQKVMRRESIIQQDYSLGEESNHHDCHAFPVPSSY